MERSEALDRINEIVGQDLRKLAEKYSVTVFKNGKKNKGWAGHVIERHLGLPINSSQSPNFGSWELKTISLKRLRNGELTVKETMAITMIDPYYIEKTPFEKSHLLTKFQKMVIAARIWEGKDEPSSVLYAVKTFDLDNPAIYAQIKADYDVAREAIIRNGFSALKSEMGLYIQPRTKGAGHGSVSRAFYARAPFLKKIFLEDTLES